MAAVPAECRRATRSLQRQCGGELPGMIAIPALSKPCARLGVIVKLARTISAQTQAVISAWIEVEPRLDGNPGCVHKLTISPVACRG
jgi:hypothetical protein